MKALAETGGSCGCQRFICRSDFCKLQTEWKNPANMGIQVKIPLVPVLKIMFQTPKMYRLRRANTFFSVSELLKFQPSADYFKEFRFGTNEGGHNLNTPDQNVEKHV